MNFIIKKIGLFLILQLIVVSLFSQDYKGKKKHIDKILENSKKFSTYFVNGDAEGVANCYTSDGKIFPNNKPILEGQEALLKYWTRTDGNFPIYHKVTPSSIKIIKNYAYDYGYYEGKTQLENGEIRSWKGKYLIIWKKVKKDWKIYMDIWNSVKTED